jgi:uncharacterized protein YuzE
MDKKINKFFEMEQDYDYVGDSLLFNITEEYNYKRSLRLTDNIIIDFDEKDVPVALELLNASKVLHTKKSFLTHPVGIEMFIGIGEETVTLNAKFTISIHHKKTPSVLNEQIANDINLSACEAHFGQATA